MHADHKVNSWEKVWMLARTDFKLRYHGSFLGILWVLLKPLCLFVVLSFVFSHVFQNTPAYALHLLTGLIFWNFFAEGTMVGITSLLSKAHIITKIFVPKWIILTAATLNTCFGFFISLTILGVFAVFYGTPVSLVAWLVLLFYAVIVFVLILITSFFLAPLYLRFRDINQIWEVILLAGFYATPIIYPIDVLSPAIRNVLYLNPMTLVIRNTQTVVTTGMVNFDWQDALYLLLVLLFGILGLGFFFSTTKRSSEHV